MVSAAFLCLGEWRNIKNTNVTENAFLWGTADIYCKLRQ